MNISWRSNPALTTRRGFTLIETLASLVILGSLLCSLVIARSNLVAQQRTAEKNIEANKVLDQLLTQWWIEDHDILNDTQQTQEGVIEGNTKYTWRIDPLPHNNQNLTNQIQLEPRKISVSLIDTRTHTAATRIELAIAIKSKPKDTTHPQK